MKYVDLQLGQPFRDNSTETIGRITQVVDMYSIIDRPGELTTEAQFKRQITIQNLANIHGYFCPVIVELDLPGGLILAVPSRLQFARARPITANGLYRLGRFPQLVLDQEPKADLASVVPLNEIPASTAQIELVLQSLELELSSQRLLELETLK